MVSANVKSLNWGNIEPVLGESGGAPAMSQMTVTAPRALLETVPLHVCQGWRTEKYKSEATSSFVKKLCATVPGSRQSAKAKEAQRGKRRAEAKKKMTKLTEAGTPKATVIAAMLDGMVNIAAIVQGGKPSCNSRAT